MASKPVQMRDLNALDDEQGYALRGRKRKTRAPTRSNLPDDDTNGTEADAAVEEEPRGVENLKKGSGVAITPYSRSRGLVVDEEVLEAHYRNSFGYRAGYLPRNRAYLGQWHRNLRSQSSKLGGLIPKSPAVDNLTLLIESDSIIRMYVTQMIDQVPEPHKVIHSISELLAHLRVITHTAPEYNKDPNQRHAFPMSELFSYMSGTPAGYAVFRNYAFNAAIGAVLKEWCEYLDSPESAKVLHEGENGWLSQYAWQDYRLWEFDLDTHNPNHWGLKSYNDFFHRPIKKAARPIAGIDENGNDDMVTIVSANDGHVLAIARDVKRWQRFWLKGEPYSLVDILLGSTAPSGKPYVDIFEGGYLFQTFLSGANYHRIHAPVSGTVVSVVTPTNGLYFSLSETFGADPDQVLSEDYFTAVNQRMLIFIEADNTAVGTVCVMPIGITEISSVRLSIPDPSTAGPLLVSKGQEIAYFSYGGSSCVLLFQNGAIDHFTAPVPPSDDIYPSDGPAVNVNACIAISHPRPLLKLDQNTLAPVIYGTS